LRIEYVPYKKINKNKWDGCISLSTNSLIYAYSYYLDNMAANWDALILNDYEAVMPLTWKKKLHVKYLYQPAFIQQGGIFFKRELTIEIMQQFLHEAMAHFKFAEITLNYGNSALTTFNDLEAASRTNYIIDLNTDYKKIYDNYDPSFTKSLRRIKKFNIQYLSSGKHQDFIQLYGELYSKRLPYFSRADFLNFKKLCALLSEKQKVITRIAQSANNKLLAAVVLLHDGHRLYNIISCITSEGKKAEANYFLYDKIIEEFSGKNLLLDMEGSDVKGIAAFYKKFNPVLQPYPFIKYNELPSLIKLFKH
jgi:hypothetical protein